VPDDADAPLESEGLAETLDLLEMLERGGELSEDQLTEMGIEPQRAAAFVKALQRLHAMARSAGGMADLQRIRLTRHLGESAVRRGEGLGADVGTGVDGAEAQADQLDRIAPPPDQDVPPHLRKILDAYYRALAERGAQP
jgi:hypothetical protein